MANVLVTVVACPVHVPARKEAALWSVPVPVCTDAVMLLLAAEKFAPAFAQKDNVTD